MALARLHLLWGRELPKAVEYARGAADRHPSVATCLLLAEACNASGDRDAAREALARAVELAPDEPVVREMYESYLEQEADGEPVESEGNSSDAP